MRVENAALRQERENMENKYRKAAGLVAQWKKDEISMRKYLAELCSKLPDMQLEPKVLVMEKI